MKSGLEQKIYDCIIQNYISTINQLYEMPAFNMQLILHLIQKIDVLQYIFNYIENISYSTCIQQCVCLSAGLSMNGYTQRYQILLVDSPKPEFIQLKEIFFSDVQFDFFKLNVLILIFFFNKCFNFQKVIFFCIARKKKILLIKLVQNFENDFLEFLNNLLFFP